MGHSTTSNRPGQDFHKVAPIEGIETLMQNDTSKKIKMAMVSFTADKYLILNHNGNPKWLGIYENGRLVRSVDFDDGPIVHAHRWETVEINGETVTRRKDPPKTDEHWQPLTKEERELAYKLKRMWYK